MSEVSTDKKLKGKDLITIGIFSAIYFVINFAFMLLGGLHPLLWILMPGFIALFTGIPYLMMCAKVQKVGSVLLMGLITGLIFFVSASMSPASSPTLRIPHQKDMIPSIVKHRVTASLAESSAPLVTWARFPWNAPHRIPRAIIPAHR